MGTTISASASLMEDKLPPPGSRLVPDLELVLSEVGTVRGSVTEPDGRPVSRVKVTLVAGMVSSLALTGGDGRFEFLGIPLGVALRLEADASTGGRAVFVGSIDANGVVHGPTGAPLDEVVLVLDVEPPKVVAMLPLQGATAVPTNTTVVVTFSEPIDPATVRSCTGNPVSVVPSLRLLESTGTPPALSDPSDPCDDSNVVPVAIAVSADGMTVTLTPLRTLKGATQHTVSVSQGVIDESGALVGGVRDLVGRPLAADFVWQFVTRDNVPPRVLTVSPADGAVNVPEESLIRVTFSEPIDSASVNTVSVAVEGPSGPVLGQRDLILGNTVAVFTPTDTAGARVFLNSNAVYTVTVVGVRDPAGNVQRPEDTVSTTFRTRDTIPPGVDSVTAPAGARPGEFILVMATTPDADVASVDFFVDGVLTAMVKNAFVPGQYRTPLGMPGRSIAVAARAVDSSGNVGALSAAVTVALLADNPPSVVITAPDPGTIVSPGTTARFVVEATDDVAVTQVRGAASGVVTTTTTRAISPPRTPVPAFFDIAVPASAPEGTLTFAAMATDSRGQTSAPVMRTLTVRDDVAPVVAIEAPGSGVVVVPGTSLDVTIRATDAADVAEVSLAVPELGFSQSAAVSPAAPTVTRTFTVPVPAPLDIATLTLVARAVDRFGRTGSAERGLPVQEVSIVQITSPAPGTEVDPRNPLGVTVTATDTHKVAEVTLTASDVVSVSETRPVNPPAR